VYYFLESWIECQTECFCCYSIRLRFQRSAFDK
jgi:hypothetical protein